MLIYLCTHAHIQGTEPDDQLALLAAADPVFLLLETPDDVSRIHAARRVFQFLHDTQSTLSVIHHVNYPVRACYKPYHMSICLPCLFVSYARDY